MANVAQSNITIQNATPSGGATCTFPGATTTGRTIVVAASLWSGTAGDIIGTPTDNQGNTYTAASASTAFNVNNDIGVWYCENAAGGATHTVTVTQQTSGGGAASGGDLTIIILELADVPAASFFGATAAGGTSATPSSGNVALTEARTFLVGAVAHGSTSNLTITEAPGWTLARENEGGAANMPLAVMTRTVTPDTPATWTLGASGVWRAVEVAFSVSQGAGGVLSWYPVPTFAPGASTWLDLRENGTAPADGFFAPVTGWIVAKTAATVYSRMDSQVERTAATFTSTVQPSGAPDTTLGDTFRTAYKLAGAFAATNWTLRLRVRSNTSAAGSGNPRFRVWKSVNADGSSPTELTAATLAPAAAAVGTGANVDFSVTWAPGALTLTDEYVFVQVAWVITAAGGATGSDVNLRTGLAITTPSFTPTAPSAPGAALAGVSAGTSTAAATGLVLTSALAGVAAGTSTVAATGLALPRALAGVSAGLSTASATGLSGPAAVLAGSATGTSTAGATTLQQTQPLAGTAAGTATATATTLALPHALVASASGTSTATALRLALPIALSAAAAGVSTAAGMTLALPHALAGAAAGTSTATGDLSAAGGAAALAGLATGVSFVTASGLVQTQPLQGASAGVSTATAPRLILNHPLIASAAGTSTASATTLRQTQPLAGVAAGISTAAGDLSISGAMAALAGRADGISSAIATTLRLTHALTGVSTGVSLASGVGIIFATRALAGRADATSTATAALTPGFVPRGVRARLTFPTRPALGVTFPVLPSARLAFPDDEAALVFPPLPAAALTLVGGGTVSLVFADTE